MIKLFVFLTFFISSAISWARPQIAISPIVEVSQRKELRLSDIVEVKNANFETLEALEQVVLREDSRDLLIRQHIESGEIIKKIREVWSKNRLLGSVPQFMVPAKVRVDFAARSLSKQEFERKALNRLRLQCNECEYQVSVQSLPQTEKHEWQIDWSPLTNAKGSFLLGFDDGLSQKKWISGSFKVLRKTPVANRFIAANEKIQSQDLSYEMRDVTFAKDDVLNVSNLEETISARSLSKGQIVWASDLKREPALKRGQIIQALIGDDGFEISLSVQAEELGHVGDVIRVKNLETKKVLSGIVIDKGVVRLQ